MSMMSPPVKGERRSAPGFSVVHLPLERLDPGVSPILMIDDFRVSSRPFGPHPHAGFSVITYVFEDSEGALRNRDSLGNDLVVGPGGIVCLQAGRGALHEETPEDPGRELHGAQIYINLSAANKLRPPETFHLLGDAVPHWSDEDGNVVRVLVGKHRNVASPLEPAEPFDLLDLAVVSQITLDLGAGAYSVIYARDAATVAAGGRNIAMAAGEVVAVPQGGTVIVSAQARARLLVLSGAQIHEPRHMAGPFALSHPDEAEAVYARYRRGEMGHLAPRP